MAQERDSRKVREGSRIPFLLLPPALQLAEGAPALANGSGGFPRFPFPTVLPPIRYAHEGRR
jgi:hypothetical protein